jgi:6,7-dimethyl-8-ribityllumazine synthase
VPGSYELPYAAQRVYAASNIQFSTSGAASATDLLASMSLSDPAPTAEDDSTALGASGSASRAPFDAIIAIGALIKGETMHFEYIADAVSHGLMRLQLDSGVPIVFGLLTVLDEDQGKAREGLVVGGHCHGEDWGKAAVELGVKRAAWGQGKFS